MPSLKETQVKLGQVIAEAEKAAADGEFTTLEAKLLEGDSLKAQIAQLERMGELSDYAGRSAGMLTLAAPGSPPPATVLSGGQAGETTLATHRSGLISLQEHYGEGFFDPKTRAATETVAYRDSLRAYLRTGLGGQLSASALRTLQEGIDTSGGYFVPPDILDVVIAKEPTPTRVAGRVTQLTTSRDNLIIPRVNYTTDNLYTTGMRVTWTGEIPASSTAMRVTDPVIGQTHIPIYTAMMSIPLTNDMIEDSAFPLVSWLTGKFAETIDLLRDNMILNGTGQGQPTGILLNPGDSAGTQPAIVNSGNASALTADGIVSLAYTLPEQYEDMACFVMNKVNTAQAIAKLKDSQNRYLWGMGYQDSGLVPGIRNRELLGYPVIWSGFMPNVAANAFPLIFGDLRGYYLVNRIGLSVQVLRELYAETNQIVILGRIRFGGQVAEQWKLLAQQVHS